MTVLRYRLDRDTLIPDHFGDWVKLADVEAAIDATFLVDPIDEFLEALRTNRYGLLTLLQQKLAERPAAPATALRRAFGYLGPARIDHRS